MRRKRSQFSADRPFIMKSGVVVEVVLLLVFSITNARPSSGCTYDTYEYETLPSPSLRLTTIVLDCYRWAQLTTALLT
ncbi:hypothetical protein EDB83DRAFT_2402878 [Lactarius deliciosus]|nr:hypothetical protein EDB83DRAFT_2402878 [Lactarius deliciosus]